MRSSPFTAVYDACVLYPAPPRDFLMWLGLSGRFRARWSPQIHDEWKRNLLVNRPDLTSAQLDRTSGPMDLAIPDGLVTGHETLITGLTLPDADDRHVLAAAIRCNASVIVTDARGFLARAWSSFEAPSRAGASTFFVGLSKHRRSEFLGLLGVAIAGEHSGGQLLHVRTGLLPGAPLSERGCGETQ